MRFPMRSAQRSSRTALAKDGGVAVCSQPSTSRTTSGSYRASQLELEAVPALARRNPAPLLVKRLLVDHQRSALLSHHLDRAGQRQVETAIEAIQQNAETNELRRGNHLAWFEIHDFSPKLWKRHLVKLRLRRYDWC